MTHLLFYDIRFIDSFKIVYDEINVIRALAVLLDYNWPLTTKLRSHLENRRSFYYTSMPLHRSKEVMEGFFRRYEIFLLFGQLMDHRYNKMIET